MEFYHRNVDYWGIEENVDSLFGKRRIAFSMQFDKVSFTIVRDKHLLIGIYNLSIAHYLVYVIYVIL